MDDCRRGGVLEHPFLLLAAGCLLTLCAFPAGNTDTPMELYSKWWLFAMLAAGTAFVCCLLLKRRGGRAGVFLCIAAAAVCAVLIFAGGSVDILVLYSLLMLVAVGFWLWNEKKLTAGRLCALLFAGGFLLRVAYILYTTYLLRQHDVLDITRAEGHQAYILYFADHNFALPDFNPYSRWEFYHPPFFYWVSAAWVKGLLACGFGTAAAVENVQILSMFFSGAAVLCGYYILRELRLKGAALVVPFAVLCFHPTFIILSGSINNDMLCIALSMAAILFAIRWYKAPSMKYIILLAVCIGLAMMTKTSGALVAPAVAVLFLVRLIKDKGKRGALWKQFGIFLLIAVPLGLWWSVYCRLRFNVPFGSISGLKPDNPQYIGYYSVAERLFGIDWQHLSIFGNWDWTNRVFDYNPFVAILKSSMFDEATLFTGGVGLFFAQLLSLVNIVLVAVSLICMVASIVFAVRGRIGKKIKDAPSGAMVLFFAVLYLSFMGFYVMFCFSEPYACTQSFRYIAPTVLFGGVAIGCVLRRMKPDGVAPALISMLTVLFCVASSAVWLLAG